MNGRKRDAGERLRLQRGRKGGREGGKVSKVLLALGAHRLMPWSSAGWNGEQGKVRMYVCVLGEGEERGSNCKHHTTVAAAANHPCNDQDPRGVSGWMGGYAFFFKGKVQFHNKSPDF